MTPEEKERIDYEIKARIDAKNKEIAEWIKAAFIAVMFIWVVISLFYYIL